MRYRSTLSDYNHCWTVWVGMDGVHGYGSGAWEQQLWSWILGPGSNPTPVWVISSITHGRVWWCLSYLANKGLCVSTKWDCYCYTGYWRIAGLSIWLKQLLKFMWGRDVFCTLEYHNCMFRHSMKAWQGSPDPPSLWKQSALSLVGSRTNITTFTVHKPTGCDCASKVGSGKDVDICGVLASLLFGHGYRVFSSCDEKLYRSA